MFNIKADPLVFRAGNTVAARSSFVTQQTDQVGKVEDTGTYVGTASESPPDNPGLSVRSMVFSGIMGEDAKEPEGVYLCTSETAKD